MKGELRQFMEFATLISGFIAVLGFILTFVFWGNIIGIEMIFLGAIFAGLFSLFTSDDDECDVKIRVSATKREIPYQRPSPTYEKISREIEDLKTEQYCDELARLMDDGA